MTLCVHFSVLGRLATSLSLCRMALGIRYPLLSSGTVFIVMWATCSGGVPCVCSSTVELWLLWHISGWEWPSGWPDLRAGHDYSRQVVMQRLTVWSRSCFSGALVPVESNLHICHLWSWFGGALMWSQAGHQVCWFWSLLWGTLVQAKSATICAPVGAAFWEL